MINNIIISISDRLNEFIKNKLSLDEDKVIVSNLVDLNKNLNLEIENKLSCFLLNIEEDKISKNSQFNNSPGQSPPIIINIYVMFAAYFTNSNYLESLRYISLVIEFFQIYNVFDSSNTPLISPGIDKVYVEISNVSIEEISKLWGNIGTSYIPSIAYKIKQVKFDGNMISEIIPNIGDKNA
tara:strand:- start:304 stop:849 length:546 start_codon:yes stop_codon:yes gene_type:complete